MTWQSPHLLSPVSLKIPTRFKVRVKRSVLTATHLLAMTCLMVSRWSGSVHSSPRIKSLAASTMNMYSFYLLTEHVRVQGYLLSLFLARERILQTHLFSFLISSKRKDSSNTVSMRIKSTVAVLICCPLNLTAVTHQNEHRHGN